MKSLILLVLISIASFANAQTAWQIGNYTKGQQCTYNRIIWRALKTFSSTSIPTVGNRNWLLISGESCPVCPPPTTTILSKIIKDTVWMPGKLVYVQDTLGYKLKTKGNIVLIDTIKRTIKY